MTPEEIATLQTDLLEFTKYMFQKRRKQNLMEAPFHKELCRTLERVVTGDINRLIINVPPRSGKTEVAVKAFIAWCMGIFPDAEFIHASYAQTLATANTAEIREIMSHEAFAAVFGAPKYRNDTNAKDHFKTKDGGHVYATGAGGTITGFGAGKMRDYFGGAIVVDDPHKAGEAASDTMRQNVLNWFTTTLESRKNSRETPIILIMQRLHEEDLSGFLLDGGNGEKWHHLVIPAIDPDGNSFWPENSNFEIDNLRRMEKSNSYVFAGQYMQRPAPIGGGIFKDSWWQYYTIEPAFEWRGIYADTAQKTKEENDYSVLQCWGRTKEGQRYLIDQIRGKWESPELRDQARAFWNKHRAVSNGKLRHMKVEDKVSGTDLIQTLRREGLPVLGVQRGTDKVTRALDAAPYVESGNVFLPRNAPWLSDFLQEASYFPNGKHDDQLDPMFDAVTDGKPIKTLSWV
jgi:predicted phage terminase large subunit-like protein